MVLTGHGIHRVLSAVASFLGMAPYSWLELMLGWSGKVEAAKTPAYGPVAHPAQNGGYPKSVRADVLVAVGTANVKIIE